MRHLSITPWRDKVCGLVNASFQIAPFFRCTHVSVTRLVAPPHTAIPFECSNGKLRLNISPHSTDRPPQTINPIDVDLSSIGTAPTAIIHHHPNLLSVVLFFPKRRLQHYHFFCVENS
jgi:hypothetical protein